MPIPSHRRRDAALAVLKTTGIWPSNYAPPVYKLMWQLGLDLPPPHFASFSFNALSTGGYFCVAFGLLMWFTSWSDQGMAPGTAALSSIVAGVLFGLAMAAYYRHGRRKFNLPTWESL